MSKFQKALAGIIPAVILLLPLVVFAGTLTTPTVPVEGDPIGVDDIEEIITNIAQFLIGVSLVIAVIAIVVGGIVYMSAGGNSARAESGKAWIINGIIGAAVVLAVGVILQTIAGVVDWASFFG